MTAPSGTSHAEHTSRSPAQRFLLPAAAAESQVRQATLETAPSVREFVVTPPPPASTFSRPG